MNGPRRVHISSSIGIRLMVGSIGLLLLIASFGMYSSVESRNTLAESVGFASEAIAESLADSMDRMIYMRGHEVLTAVEDYRVFSAVNDSNALYDAMADPEAYIDQADEEWVSAPLNETTELMEEILGNNLSEHLTANLIEHYTSAHGMEIFGEILIANKYGALVAATDRTTDFRQNDEDWWMLAQAGEFVIGDATYDESSGVYGIFAHMLVKDASGQMIGAAKAVINILTIAKDIELTALGYETSELKIVTPDGKMIFSSRAYTIFENVSAQPFFEQVSGARGHFSEKEGDVSRLFSYATATGYLEYDGHGWIIFLSHAEQEVLGPAIDLQSRMLLVSLLTIAFAAVLSVYISHLVTGPLGKLEDATRNMAKGGFDKRIKMSRSDEFGRLANSFNEMASELESLYLDLDQRVKERTDELEKVNKKLAVLASITRHDAMNLMTVQKGLLYMAKEVSKDPQVNDYLRKAEITSDNLVAFFRFMSEYEEVGVSKPVWTNLNEAFASAVAGLDLTGRELKAQLEGVDVFVDPMFPKVLHNLVTNSLKHGKTSTSISLSYSEGPDGLMIVMEDNGVGVPAERKEAIFQRDRTASGRSRGLFLSAEILRITNISIKETGVPGKGVRFEIRVPKGGYRFVDAAGDDAVHAE